ncbi:MAG: T9SS type A sorting domain-containing protein [Candidatus Kapabacteria bacterium]|nr:T9SS type A sorting domain-containing protein [Ignavibacteriota bacterium]MCW5884910.1 T9SS type A sorting domain-containing protein [Candidatus Kapabacteria bacterium]
MTKYIIILLLSVTSLIAQNFEPGQQLFKWGLTGDSIYISSDLEYFRQTKPILGWHWGGSYKLSKSLLVNQNDAFRHWENWGFTINDFVDSCHIILKPDEYSHAVGPEILNARAIQFEPTLRLDPAEPNKLVIRSGDTTRPIFGFTYIRGQILSDPTRTNFNRLIIDSTALIGQVILDKPWPPHQFTRFGWSKPNGVNAQKVRDSFLLDKMYLSINLRRSSFGYSGDTVLKIELPFTMKEGPSGFLRFATVPSNTITDTLELQRGCYRKDVVAPNNNTRALIITKNMIPQGNKDITISALILFNNEIGPEPEQIGNIQLNLHHPEKEHCDPNYIDSIGIRVTYISDNPVMIDWIRLESPHAKEFLKGTFDNSIATHVQEDLNKYLDNSYQSRGIKLFRYNTIVEGGLFNWITEKYFNRLIGNIGTNEVGVYYPSHYEYYVNPPDRWIGSYQMAPNVATSYSRKKYGKDANSEARTLGLINGYNGINDSLTNISSYETFLQYYSDSLYILPITYFLDNMDMTKYEGAIIGSNGWRASFLGHWEGQLFKNYFKPETNGLLFSNLIWWSQNFILNGTKEDVFTNNHFYFYRPQTAEELRLACLTNLIIGSKGLIYDGPDTDTNGYYFFKLYDGNNLSNSTRDSLEVLSDMEFLDSDVTGSDWIREVGEVNRLNDYIMPLDTIALYLERPKDKIYFGRRTQRLELRKIHEFVRNNEYTIMKLRLQCWWAKGFKKWYMQDSNITYNLIDKYIDTNAIRTREITNSEPEGTALYNFIDSSFYDITILKYDTLSLNDVFYMGTVNRRTSPLILENDTLRFYSGAEFDNFMDFGGTSLTGEFKPTDYWQDLYWKRQGCREITIPTNIIDPSKNIYYKIEELAYNEDYSESLPFWKKEQIRNRVKITIPQGQSFATKYLPGEGKMFKVNIINDNTAPFAGELAFSNQTKIIAYPANQTSNYDFEKDGDTLNFFKDDSMYYHIVYDRAMPNNLSRVYYRRSAKAYDRTVNTKIIEWGPEILVSDKIVFTKADHLPSMQSDTALSVAGIDISCKYPSIVVRYDDTTRVYIVFGCSMPAYTDTSRVFIVESVFPADTNFVFPVGPNNLKPITYGYTDGDAIEALDKWGPPAINASFFVNYYSWSDSIYGIGVGCKSPDDRGLITNKKYIKYDLTGDCCQPSLNTYSRLNIEENECALVFKEHSEGQDRIIYSRLRIAANDSIDNYVPLQFCDTEPFHQMCWYGHDNKTSLINFFQIPPQFNSEYPVVYRPVDFARRPGFEVSDSLRYLGASWDRVYWQADVAGDYGFQKRILLKNIDINDNLDCWYMLPSLHLYMPFYSLNHASPGPGAPSSKKDSTFHRFALFDSSFVLNFVKHELFSEPNYNSDIYQVNFSAWLNYLERWNKEGWVPSDGEVDLHWWSSVGQGIYPHTTHTPVITENKDWFIHNRIYQATNNEIRTSALLFLKGVQDRKTIYPMLRISDSSSVSKLSEIYSVNNKTGNRFQTLKINAFTKDKNGKIIPKESIESEWFRIDDIKELAYYTSIQDTSLFSIELERYDRGKSVKIPLNRDMQEKLNSKKITLLNGKNHLYRLKLTKKDKNVNTWVDLVFDDYRDIMSEFSELSTKELGKVNNDVVDYTHQIIDLSEKDMNNDNPIQLQIYPNPADDAFYVVSTILTEENNNTLVKYSLFNSTGEELIKFSGKPDEVLMINSSSLANGIYFLRAESPLLESSLQNNHIITKTIIIRR